MQAGDSMSPNLTKEIVNTFPKKMFYLMYGQTEASPRLTYLNPRLVKEKPASVGKAISGLHIKVIDNKNKECGVGEKGEIIAHGSNIMLGYWKNKNETKKTIKRGWLYTGDIGFKDKGRDLYIIGRKKDFIKTGANKIDPAEIEQLAMKNAKVMQAAAIGIPDVILGESIRLYITALPDERVTEKEIIQMFKKTKPSYKIPKKVIILKSIVKNSYGKIDKKRLKKR